LAGKAEVILGKNKVHDLPIRLTSEDFAYYSQVIPACFFRLGVRNEKKGIIYSVHHPKFDIDEDALIVGMQLMSAACF
jgi:hippurate hydrolase